jgi:hypothetical protein
VNSSAQGRQNGIAEVRGKKWVPRDGGVRAEKKGLSGVLYATFRAQCGGERREGSGGLNVA